MSILKKLAGQTAIYGIPSIVGRLINFLLIFLFTQYFDPTVFAAHTEFYAYAAFFLVLIPHGMETAYFNFIRRGEDIKEVFTTTFVSVLVLVLSFTALAFVFSQQVADFMNYSEHPEYVRWFALILLFDVLAMIPFAQLRHLQKAKRFALIRSLGIFVNIGLNVVLIVFFPRWFTGEEWFYSPSMGIGYVFIANLIASAMMFLLLIPDTLRYLGSFNKQLWKKMMGYAWPLIFVGLAGIVNETFDRAAMDKLLTSENPKFDIGVYGAFYKLSIIITIFIQAFRYAAEPFFFERAKDKDAKLVYAEVMNYFVATCLIIALSTQIFIHEIAPLAIRQSSYFNHVDALNIVPILLLANVFLGVLYNLSIWYKVEERTKLGAAISIGGAAMTIVLLLAFVPRYGIIAAATTTLLVYVAMTIASYFMGQKYYPVPYKIGKMLFLLLLAVAIYFMDLHFLNQHDLSNSDASQSSITMLLKALIVICYSVVVYIVVIRPKKN
ncbi:MAG: polysaccharide biosynthesis C-terminal domain-containing protein [Bacteroidia bacterium]